MVSILILLSIIHMSESSNSNILSQFNQLMESTDLEKLGEFDKKTPKFTLKNAFKICDVMYTMVTLLEVYSKIMVNTINGLFVCMDTTPLKCALPKN